MSRGSKLVAFVCTSLQPGVAALACGHRRRLLANETTALHFAHLKLFSNPGSIRWPSENPPTLHVLRNSICITVSDVSQLALGGKSHEL